MRAFLAVELPDESRVRLSALTEKLAESRADVKWVEPQNLHVTMRFLGDISQDQLADIRTRLQTVERETPKFDAQLSQPGAFPSIRAPRVIWMGIGEGHEALSRIAVLINDGLGALGIVSETRKFVAHVTLGRARSSRGLDRLSRQLSGVSWSAPQSFAVGHITLFESRLSSAGSVYTTLARFPLSG